MKKFAKIQALLLVTIISILISPMAASAKVKFSNTENLNDSDTVYNFSGTETFSGNLEYDDCGKKSGLPRVGCPSGYGFTLHDQNEMNKIPLEKTRMQSGAYFCGMRSCDLFFMLGDKDEYTPAENAKLQKLLKSGKNKEIKIMLTNISLSNYPSAHFTMHTAATPKKLPGSGPELEILLLLSVGGATFMSLRKNSARTKKNERK